MMGSTSEPDYSLAVLDWGGYRVPSLIQRLREIHGGDDVRHKQKDARLGESFSRYTLRPNPNTDLLT